jgi:hypothetical protein
MYSNSKVGVLGNIMTCLYPNIKSLSVVHDITQIANQEVFLHSILVPDSASLPVQIDPKRLGRGSF